MLLGSVPLVKYGPRPKVRRLRNLLSGNSSAAWGGDYSENSDGVQSEGSGGDFISYWKPEVSLP